jgi:hypothetical protein
MNNDAPDGTPQGAAHTSIVAQKIQDSHSEACREWMMLLPSRHGAKRVTSVAMVPRLGSERIVRSFEQNAHLSLRDRLLAYALLGGGTGDLIISEAGGRRVLVVYGDRSPGLLAVRRTHALARSKRGLDDGASRAIKEPAIH